MIEMSGSEFLIAILLSILSGFALGNLLPFYKEQREEWRNIVKGKNNKKVEK